jgi:hypothetical protein
MLEPRVKKAYLNLSDIFLYVPFNVKIVLQIEESAGNQKLIILI